MSPHNEEDKEIFIVGKINLNNVREGDGKSPFIEIVLDTASGRSEGDIILLKQVSSEENDYYTKKIPFEERLPEHIIQTLTERIKEVHEGKVHSTKEVREMLFGKGVTNRDIANGLCPLCCMPKNKGDHTKCHG